MNYIPGTIKIGQHYAFRYCFDYPGTTMPELRARMGQQALVIAVALEPEDDDQESEPVFSVRFPDGLESHAFESELEDSETLMSVMPFLLPADPTEPALLLRCPVCPSNKITKSIARSYIKSEADGPEVVVVTTEHTCDECGASFWI